MAIERCEGCEFAWDLVDARNIGPRIVIATASFAQVLLQAPGASSRRPEPARWSALEYGGHVRDVLFNLRDRVIAGAAVDSPMPLPMFGTPRIELGLYRSDLPPEVASELVVAGKLFARTFDALPSGMDLRPLFYPYPRQATRTIRWVASQALHECEHHLGDARENLERIPTAT